MLAHGEPTVHRSVAEIPRAGRSLGDRCRYCGSDKLFTVRCSPPARQYARAGCSACGRFLRWEPAPWTRARAAEFIMPFGRFRGRPLAELTRTPDGRSYLRWPARETEGNAAAAAAILLDDGRAGR